MWGACLGLDFYDLANPEWFTADPELAWGFYGHRLNLYRRTVPHPGFGLLLKWAAARSAGYFVFTSNVDGQFQKAGFDAEHIHECHGSLHYLQCLAACSDRIWPTGDPVVIVEEETMRARPPLPKCPNCGRLARPNVLMFGDWGWQPQQSQAQAVRLSAWLETIGGTNLAIIECGAGTAVPSVRHMSERLLAQPDTRLVRINTGRGRIPPQTGRPGWGRFGNS